MGTNLLDFDHMRKDFESSFPDELEKEDNSTHLTTVNTTNVVSGDVLRKVQNKTLKETADIISKTFGPMGSNSKIISGSNYQNIQSAYSKDGLKVLKNIQNSNPIEASILAELIDITTHVEKEVGDGTTSTVILSSLIFDKLMKIQKKFNIPPFQLIRRFELVVELIKNQILSNKKECTYDDIYNISMISTNGNEEVSNNIRDIYEKYGMDVDLSVGISNSVNHIVKEYDGLTITEGYSDPAYINNEQENTANVHNARIYHFADPIDTIDMIQLFESIINTNIYERIMNDEAPIPTVITCPKISKDTSSILKKLVSHLYAYDQQGIKSNKPEILIITNVVASDELIMDDIANLCGCKSISKYIDPKIRAKDQEEGKAPTIENVAEFCAGYAELVSSDEKHTKFINPKYMKTVDEKGNVVEDPIYTSMINFLETEIKNTDSTATANEKGLLKKRLAALKANMVEYLVGGVTISDRDATKDLVEDAIKNCRSAALYGVGYAANYEGFKAAYSVYMDAKGDINHVDSAIIESILLSYVDISKILYGTVEMDEDKISEYIDHSIELGAPYDISNGYLPEDINEVGENVKCSIMLDSNILDTISKIITIMVTCNQCLLQSTSINTY